MFGWFKQKSSWKGLLSIIVSAVIAKNPQYTEIGLGVISVMGAHDVGRREKI